MTEFNKYNFIDNTIDAVLRAFEKIKISIDYYDDESNDWDFDKIREEYKDKFRDIHEDVLYDRIESQLTYSTDCWKICQMEIGERNFSDYSDYFTNIQSLTRDVLQFTIDQKYNFDEVLERYLEGLEAPEKNQKICS